jgi:hypothetical protein
MRQRYFFRPLDHGINSEQPDFNTAYSDGVYPVMNCVIDQRSVQSRWGYSEYRDLSAPVYDIVVFQQKDGTRNTLYLTSGDLCKKESGASKTWSYLTQSITYTAKIAAISGTTVTLKAGETPSTDGVADGDYFILNDDLTSDEEPDTHWSSIASASDIVPSITLDASYSGTTGSWGGSEKTGYVRQVYTIPTGERWSWAIVDDKFCFGNGNINTQYWSGTGFTDDLNASVAIKARYLLHYANRLVIGDFGSTRDPLGIAWSKEGDPTDFSDSTYGEQQFLDTSSFITGLGKVGSSIFVYKRNSIIIGNRSGIATAPLEFPTERKGIGCEASYSIIEFKGTNAFLGRDDFYVIDGDYPVSIGAKIRNKFFDITSYDNIQKTWGFKNDTRNELVWITETEDGQLGFCWNYRNNEWTVYQFAHEITGAGTGAV